LPSSLGNLTNVRYIKLNINQLSEGIPPEIGNLTNLEYLELEYNQLSGSIPPELGNLHLWYLNLSDNQIATLPTFMIYI
jgi:Leucine-rich repeat (LRR) protein